MFPRVWEELGELGGIYESLGGVVRALRTWEILESTGICCGLGDTGRNYESLGGPMRAWSCLPPYRLHEDMMLQCFSLGCGAKETQDRIVFCAGRLQCRGEREEERERERGEEGRG